MNKRDTNKRIIIIAGPNGAGKTTFAREYLPNEANCPVFINTDLIAEGLSPFQPDVAAVQAGRLMLKEIGGYARAGKSFAFETTLSGRAYINRIRRWRADGYRVKLVFLSLTSSEEAIRRVRLRARHGGHFVPAAMVRRRFDNGLQNFRAIYRDCVDEWCLYDNSGTNAVLLEQQAENNGEKESLMRAAKRAHLIAYQNGIGVVVVRDGQIVEIEPDPAMYEGLKARAHKAAQYLAKVGGSAPDIKSVPRRHFD